VIALVTGASEGIGRAPALSLAARGVDIALVARTESTLDTVRAEVEKAGVRAIAVSADVGVSKDVLAMHARVKRELGVPDVIVHAAGIVRRLRIEDMTDADWDDVVAVNMRALFLVTRAFMTEMKAQKRGRIVVVGSISSTLGTATLTSYCASKWGAVGFTKALAEELRGTGLSTLCLLPGSVDTKMLKGSGFSPRMSPEEVGTALTYACLDAPPSMNGASIEMFGP